MGNTDGLSPPCPAGLRVANLTLRLSQARRLTRNPTQTQTALTAVAPHRPRARHVPPTWPTTSSTVCPGPGPSESCHSDSCTQLQPVHGVDLEPGPICKHQVRDRGRPFISTAALRGMQTKEVGHGVENNKCVVPSPGNDRDETFCFTFS